MYAATQKNQQRGSTDVTHTLHRSLWHTSKMTDTLTVISAECGERLSGEPTNLLLTVTWVTDRWTHWCMKTGEKKKKKRKDQRSQTEAPYDEPTKARQNGRRKWCMLEVRQGHFPLLVASICGIGLHTHTHMHSTSTWRWRLDYWSHRDRRISKDRRGLFRRGLVWW